jgi:four helix bundle protein
MQDFRTLPVWRQGHRLRLAIYAVSGGFPVAEQYVLTPQIRRSASSICWNSAEGCGRGSDLSIS